jgi:hypothetical protein
LNTSDFDNFAGSFDFIAHTGTSGAKISSLTTAMRREGVKVMLTVKVSAKTKRIGNAEIKEQLAQPD